MRVLLRELGEASVVELDGVYGRNVEVGQRSVEERAVSGCRLQ